MDLRVVNGEVDGNGCGVKIQTVLLGR
ncbi:hypothetical protein A2U01_0029368, partial [Trifolium medium]|nr:hypothetical protein [Trifolium medium]